jgi:hypothetical protein
MKYALFLAALAAIAILCPQSAGAATPVACKIVSTADAGQLLGTPIVSVVTTPSAGNSTMCSYRTSSFMQHFTLAIVPFKSPDEARTEFHAMVSSPMNQVAPSQSISGLGDEAHRLGPAIYVLKRNNIYVFTLVAKDGNGAGALKTIALAKASIARL